MKLGEPVMRIGQQEVAHLVTAIVENVGAPFLMLTQARIFMLKQCCAIKACERPVIFWKVAGHPIQNHTDMRLVAGVNQKTEIVRAAKTVGNTKVASSLIAPG